MFKDSDSAVEELLTWKEGRAAWIYGPPARDLPRNYPPPDFLHPRHGGAPLPGCLVGIQAPPPHIIGGIDTDAAEQLPEDNQAGSTRGGPMGPRSDAIESEAEMRPNPTGPMTVQL